MAGQRDLVMIGWEEAGQRLIRALVSEARQRYRITVFGAPAHNSGATVLDWEWYQSQGINLHLNARAVTIDWAQQVVHGTCGVIEHYDDLVFADRDLILIGTGGQLPRWFPDLPTPWLPNGDAQPARDRLLSNFWEKVREAWLRFRGWVPLPGV